MTLLSQKSILNARLKRQLKEEKLKSFKLEDHLFPQQLAFVADPSSNVVAVCSRRAGKSTAVAADLVMTATKTPDCTALYITGSRADAKKIIWTELLKFNRTYKLGGVPNISELTLKFDNGSVVRLEGAKDEQDVEKIRGQMPPIKKVFIDEAQSIRDSVLTKLIDDVLEAALMDYAAPLCLLGTPSPIATGYFYRVAHNLKQDGSPLESKVWSLHGWTFFNNPHIALKSKQTHDQILQRVLVRRGVSIDNPSIQREYFGKWTSDSDSLLLHYDPKKNSLLGLPNISPRKYSYIMGIDLGFDDSDAIAVLAYEDNSPNTYLVEELVVPQQGITELSRQIEMMQNKYDISKMVIDQGGLGKKIAEELRRQYSIPVERAEKDRKMEYIAFLNDHLRTGRFKAPLNSKFAQDSYLVEIDKDKSTSDRIVVSKRYHSDIIDAVLYAFRESPAFAWKEPPKQLKYGSKEWADAQSNSMFEAELEGHIKAKEMAGDLEDLGWK